MADGIHTHTDYLRQLLNRQSTYRPPHRLTGRLNTDDKPPSIKPAPQKSSPLHPVFSHLARPRLAKLLSRTHELSRRQRLLNNYLPLHLQPHVHLQCLNSEQWIVETDSPVWATRLRYLLPDLRRPLEEKLKFPIPKPRLKVRPPQTPILPARHLKLTRQAATRMAQELHAVSDTDLRQALLKLTRHCT